MRVLLLTFILLFCANANANYFFAGTWKGSTPECESQIAEIEILEEFLHVKYVHLVCGGVEIDWHSPVLEIRAYELFHLNDPVGEIYQDSFFMYIKADQFYDDVFLFATVHPDGKLYLDSNIFEMVLELEVPVSVEDA